MQLSVLYARVYFALVLLLAVIAHVGDSKTGFWGPYCVLCRKETLFYMYK